MIARQRLRSRLAWLAYFALALQVLVVAPHLHLGSDSAHRSPFVAARRTVPLLPHAPPCHHDQDNCPVCLALHAGGGEVPAPLAPAAPLLVALDLLPGEQALKAPAPDTASFRARAPPA